MYIHHHQYRSASKSDKRKNKLKIKLLDTCPKLNSFFLVHARVKHDFAHVLGSVISFVFDSIKYIRWSDAVYSEVQRWGTEASCICITKLLLSGTSHTATENVAKGLKGN